MTKRTLFNLNANETTDELEKMIKKGWQITYVQHCDGGNKIITLEQKITNQKKGLVIPPRKKLTIITS